MIYLHWSHTLDERQPIRECRVLLNKYPGNCIYGRLEWSEWREFKPLEVIRYEQLPERFLNAFFRKSMKRKQSYIVVLTLKGTIYFPKLQL